VPNDHLGTFGEIQAAEAKRFFTSCQTDWKSVLRPWLPLRIRLLGLLIRFAIQAVVLGEPTVKVYQAAALAAEGHGGAVFGLE